MGPYFYTGFTLVDITNTNDRSRVDSPRRQQQRNWETILQVTSLRTQPQHISGPIIIERNLDEWGSCVTFGEMYTGRHKIWVWEWAVDYEDIFSDGIHKLGLLERDFEQVPIINGLDETARFMLPIFYPYGAIKNVHILPYGVNINLLLP